MYYKVIFNKKVIDVLDGLHFVRFQPKHSILLTCDYDKAQGILSSDGTTAYHTSECEEFPVDTFLNVTIIEIDKNEYEQLQSCNLKTPEEIAENVIAELMERGWINLE